MGDLRLFRSAHRNTFIERSFSATRLWHARKHKRVRRANAFAFKNFGDGLLDYMEAGPKLRKWYGEGERQPQDGGPDPEEEEEGEPAGGGDSILVTDAESATGELLLLQLMLARLKVTALVRDTAATQQAFGEYVDPVQGAVDNKRSLMQGLRKCRAVICTGKLGALPDLLASSKQVDHVVLLTSTGTAGPGLFGKLLGSEQAVLADPGREEALRGCNVPLTVVNVGKLENLPGGGAKISLVQGDESPEGSVSREDVTQLLVRALGKRPSGVLRFGVLSKRMREQFQGWDGLFHGLKEIA